MGKDYGLQATLVALLGMEYRFVQISINTRGCLKICG